MYSLQGNIQNQIRAFCSYAKIPQSNTMFYLWKYYPQSEYEKAYGK